MRRTGVVSHASFQVHSKSHAALQERKPPGIARRTISVLSHRVLEFGRLGQCAPELAGAVVVN